MEVRGSRGMAYHKLAALEISALHADERVVALALAECGGVDVGRKEAEGGEDTGMEGGLVVLVRRWDNVLVHS